MPIIEPFSAELQTSDMIYGTSKGIDSLYKVYAAKNVHVDKGNKGADFAISEKVVKVNEQRVSKADALSQTGFSKEGISRNRVYIKAYEKLPKKYVDSITGKHEVRTIRRKCKSILYWQLIIKGLRVQFVVSGLDLNAVPKKHTYLPKEENLQYSDRRLSSNEANKELGITDAELRWVFRNRKVDAVQKGVQFWKTSDNERYGVPIPCQAPWDMEAYKVAWKEYDLSVEKKRLKEIDQRVEELFSTNWMADAASVVG